MMSSRRHSTININEPSYIKPKSSQGTRRKRTFLEENTTHSRFQLNKRKKELIQQGKYTEIQRENRILLTKITGIMGKPKRNIMSAVKYEPKRSLNSGYQKKVWEQIEIDNAKILQRIMKQKSVYSFGVNRPTDPSQTRRIRSRKLGGATQDLRGKSKSERPFVLQRIMRFNSTMMRVQILLTRETLTIQGKTQKGSMKVITIPRQQALDFISSQCNSNIQKLFDRLTYNNGTLYLVGDGENAQEGEDPQQLGKREGEYGDGYMSGVKEGQYQGGKEGEYKYQESREYGVQPSSQLPKLKIVDEIGFIELDGSYEVLGEHEGGKDREDDQ